MKTFVTLTISKATYNLHRGRRLGSQKVSAQPSRWSSATVRMKSQKPRLNIGANEVIVVDDAALTRLPRCNRSPTLTALAAAATPDLILFPTTARTREFAAMSAVDLSTGVLTDVAKFEHER